MYRDIDATTRPGQTSCLQQRTDTGINRGLWHPLAYGKKIRRGQFPPLTEEFINLIFKTCWSHITYNDRQI